MGAFFGAGLFVAALFAFSQVLFGGDQALPLAIVLVSVLLASDLLRTWAGFGTSTGFSRQTPKRWGQTSLLGVFAWGLDTGVPVTTIRATPLPALGVVLTLSGMGSPLGGLAYALGLSVGVVAGVWPGTTEQVVNRRDARARTLAKPAFLLAPTVGVLVFLSLTFGMR